MRPYRARFREQGVFFAFQSWAGCITNIFGFDLRQAQARISASSSFLAATMNQKSSLPEVPQLVSQVLTGDTKRVVMSLCPVSTLLTRNVGWSTERSPVAMTKEVAPRALSSSKNVENRYAAVGTKLRRR